MSARLNRLWRLAARPKGAFKASDFQWVEEPARAPAEGEILVRSVYLSLDPTQRNWANEQASYLPPVGLGEVMRGGVIGVVEESRDPAFKPGDRVQGVLGWQSYATVPARAVTALPAIPGLPLDAYFGLLGHIGATAYFGLLDVGQAKAGETRGRLGRRRRGGLDRRTDRRRSRAAASSASRAAPRSAGG